jgi:WD40 repeat protein
MIRRCTLLMLTVLCAAAQAQPPPEFERWRDLGAGLLQDAAFSPDGRRLTLATSLDVRLFTIEDRTLTEQPPIFERGIAALEWSPDGATLALVEQSSDVQRGVLHLWDAQTRTLRYENWLISPERSIGALAFHPDGEMLAVRADQVYVLDVNSGEAIILPQSEQMQEIAWSPDGTRLAAVGSRTPLRVWQIDGAELLLTVTPEAPCCDDVGWLEDGVRIAVRQGSAPQFFDAQSGERVQRGGPAPDLYLPGWYRSQNVASADGSYTTRYDAMNETLSVLMQDDQDPIAVLEGFTDVISSVSWLDDDQLASYGGVAGSCGVRTWDAEVSQVINRENVCGDGPGFAWTISPDEQINAAAGWVYGSNADPLDVVVWNDEYELRLEGHTEWVVSMAWSPDQHFLITVAENDPLIHFWSIELNDDGFTGELLFTREHEGVTRAVFSPDGQWIASGDAAGSVRIWYAASGMGAAELESGYGAVADLAWSPDGQQLAVGHYAGVIVIWRNRDG